MLFRFLLLFIILFGKFCSLFAQVGQAGMPKSFEQYATLVDESMLPIFSLLEVDHNVLAAADALADPKNDAFRYGTVEWVDIDLRNTAQHELLPDGSHLWRMRIYSKYALSLNMVYSHYRLPPGASLFLYNLDHSSVLGAFTHLNNKEHGQFSTGLVAGETTIIEYHQPANVAFEGDIRISQIIHGYRGFHVPEKDYGDSGSCNNNVNCPEAAEWQAEKRTVAMMLEGGFRFCSGAMINNLRQDCTPYFLTANHCTQGGNPATWLFMFNYESPTCSNQDGPTNQTVSGAVMRASDGPSDFALLELSEIPPPEYGVFYAGWSAEQIPATAATGIHHPAGDVKKITFNNDPLVLTDDFTGVAESHWQVTEWEDGTTEGGSSGSPLFDQNHRIVGQLHGGAALCSVPDGYDTYGSFAFSWNRGNTPDSRLRDWLDPDATGLLFVDGKACSEAEFELDAAITQIQNIDLAACSGTTKPFVSIRNNGANSLTSFVLQYQYNNDFTLDYEWTGNLGFFQTVTVELPSAILNQGSYVFSVQLTSINGVADPNSANNALSFGFSIAEPSIQVNLNTDQYSDETSFVIIDQANNVLINEPVFEEDFNLYLLEYCLAAGCYTLLLRDSYGDGFGEQGACALFVNGNNMGNVIGDFGEETSIEFCIEAEAINAAFNFSPGNACPNQAISFSPQYATATQFQWTFEGGTPATAQNANPSVTFANEGAHTVTLLVTDETGNTASSAQTITVGLDANISHTNSQAPETNDGIASVSVSFGTPPFSYLWSNGQTGSTATSLAVGNYAVTVMNTAGCAEVLNVEIGSDLPLLELDISIDHHLFCLDDNIIANWQASRTPQYVHWQLSNDSTIVESDEFFPTFVPTQVGDYTLTVTVGDEYAEVSGTFFFSVLPLPQINAAVTNPTLGFANGNIDLSTTTGTPDIQYLWSNGGTNGLVNQLSAQTYNVTVTDGNYCANTASYTLQNEVNDPSGVVVFPNPVVGEWHIYSQYSDSDLLTFALYDAAGKAMTNQAIPLVQGDNVFVGENALNLAAGVYIVRIKKGEMIIKNEKTFWVK